MIVGGTHKWLYGGGMGLAFAYLDPELVERIEPVYPGWVGHASLKGFADDFVPHAGARRFEQGTPALEPIYTARAGLSFVQEVSVDALRARSLQLTERLARRAMERGLSVRTPLEAAQRGGMIVLDVPDAGSVVDALAEAGIDVDERAGAGLRIGPHPCVTDEECDRTIDAIAAAVGA